VDGRRTQGVTVIVQNSDPFTYFGPRPIRVCEGAALDNGTLSLTVLERASALDMPTLIPRLFSAKARTVQRHRRVAGFPAIDYAQVRALEGTFPLQVDGDFIGDFEEASYGVVPNALSVVS
jgi:diacylglycerol kinase family enzyme